MKTYLRRLIAGLGDDINNTLLYYYLHICNGVFPPLLHLKRPRTFNDKIIYLKTRVRYEDASQYVDKIRARDYVANVCGSKYLVPLLGVWKSAEEIDYNALPRQFVLKTNHGSGMNILCHDKKKLDIQYANHELNRWLATDYSNFGHEYQYKGIKPRVLAEEMLVPADGGELKDFKVFCFRGEPRFIQVDIDRHTNHTRNFYDLQWGRLPFSILYPAYHGEVRRPKGLEEMLDVARKLSHRFVFARIDLYEGCDAVYFSEITLHHGGGFEPVLPRKYAEILGEYIDLDGLETWRGLLVI